MSETPLLTTPEQPRRPSLTPPTFDLLAKLLLAALLFYVLGPQLSEWTKAGLRLETSLIVVVAIVVVLGSVFLLARLMATAGLANRAHALAMPEGSVRALIALILIVVFAVFVGLFFERLIAKPGPIQADFAKQVVVLLGTLLTAVTSFYFAEKAMAQSAVGMTPPAPIIYRVSPPRLRRGETNNVFVDGSALAAATGLSLRRGRVALSAYSLRGYGEGISANFDIPPTIETGYWTVVLEFAGGVTANLNDAVEIF